MLSEQTFTPTTTDQLLPTFGFKELSSIDTGGIFSASLVNELSDLSRLEKPETENLTTKEIPNPEQDKIIVILNFLIKEVLPIKNRQQQIDLLIYFFRSILSETQRLPITHLAYDIAQKESGEIALYDDVYKLRPDLLQICEDAVQSLVINQAEKDRYLLEKQQIEQLLLNIRDLFNQSPHAWIALISEDKKEVKTNRNPENKTQKILENKGWKTLSPTDSFQFIRPEVRRKMGLTEQIEPITIGPKYLYLMPQSEVHEGNLSVMVIAQPIFIPSLNRFILLHDQHMAPRDWSDHKKLFTKLGISVPENFSDLDFKAKEKFVMEQLISLPNNFQEKTASDTFLEIFPENKFFKKIRQKITRKKIEKMEPALKEYAELVLDTFSDELKNDPNLETNTVNKLGIFIKRVVLAGILDVKKISSKKRVSIFEHFKKYGNLGEEAFALSLAKNLNFSSATKAFNTSLIECVALSPIGSVQQLIKLRGSFDFASLSRKDLAKYIGSDRAKDWSMGSCVRCGSLNTWIGECDWCLSCEMNYKSPPNYASSTKNSSPINPSFPKKTMPIINKPAETLGGFIANLI